MCVCVCVCVCVLVCVVYVFLGLSLNTVLNNRKKNSAREADFFQNGHVLNVGNMRVPLCDEKKSPKVANLG